MLEIESLHLISVSSPLEILSTAVNDGEKQMVHVYCPVGRQEVYLHLNLFSAETNFNLLILI